MRSRRSELALYGADVDEATLRRAFTSGDVPVAVYGLGKMGLPLAAVYGEVTGNVVGVDVDESVVATVENGDCHVAGEPGLPELVDGLVDRGALSATTRATAAAEDARLHVVIVPTLLTDDGAPDLAALRAATESIAAGLAPGDLVVIESTVPPGTTRDVVQPLLCEESGLAPDAFGLAFCPERTASGRALRDVRGAYPKVVGGRDDESTRAAALVYDEVSDNEVVTTGDVTTAECVKVFEGLYRDVNIALANDLGRVAGGLDADVREAIEVANTQPYCDIHSPGPGVGGHCIPVYPHFVTDRVPGEMPLVETGRAVNDDAPVFVADVVRDVLGDRDALAGQDTLDHRDATDGQNVPDGEGTLDGRKGSLDDATVLLCGGTYRAGVAETRNAPARGIARELDDAGADVRLTDPMLAASDVADWPVAFSSPAELDRAAADAVVLVTAHEAFLEWDWSSFEEVVLVDTRAVVDPADHEYVQYTVGRGFENGVDNSSRPAEGSPQRTSESDGASGPPAG